MRETALFRKIIGILGEHKIEYELFEHTPVYTSEQASGVSGHAIAEGTKSLALTTEKGLLVVTVSGIERVDFQLLRKLLDVKTIKMCDLSIIGEELGAEAGGLAPFGYENHIQVVVSKTLFDQKYVYFNPGRNDATIRVDGTMFRTIMLAQGAKIL